MSGGFEAKQGCATVDVTYWNNKHHFEKRLSIVEHLQSMDGTGHKRGKGTARQKKANHVLFLQKQSFEQRGPARRIPGPIPR